MSLVAGAKVSKTYGLRTLFDDVEFTLNEGCRVGLIGANGSGKTSLFRIVLGADEEHDGRVTRQRNLRISTLDQDPKFPEGVTVREAMLSADAELLELEQGMHHIHHELEKGGDTDALLARLGVLETRFEARNGWELESRAERILEGIGIPKELRDAQVSTLSGGEKGRLAFARLLVQEPDLWLLDEPTNHLDIDGILFVENFLRDSKAAAVVVSHDRRFLDQVTNETWEIENAQFYDYPASYSQARVLRGERLKAAKRQYANQQSFIEKEDAFIRRYQAGQRARQATGRLKRLDRLARVDRPEDRVRVMDLALSSGDSPGMKILALRDVGMSFGERTLFDHLNIDLSRGEILGVAGPNGAGKTTLMKILMGELKPTAGEMKWGERVRVGTLSQHEVFPDEKATPYSFMRSAAPKITELQLRNMLAAMLFPGDAVDRPLGGLSGGERKRLMLTKLLVEGHNVLLLDEPTNHLDIPSREALELALATYEGTLIVVSHDRYFVDSMADRMLWIEDGAATLTDGGFTEALEKRMKRKEAAAAVAKLAPKPAATPTAPTVQAPSKPKSPYTQLKTGEIEKRMADAEARLRDLEAGFAKPEIFRDAARLKAGQEEAARLKSELAALESEWLARTS